MAWPTLPSHCVISSIGTRFQGPEPASCPPSSRWQLFSQGGGPGLRTQTQSSHTNKHPDILCPEPAPNTSSDLELPTPLWSWTKGKERAKFLRERPLCMGSELRTGSAKAGIQQLDACVPPGSPRGQPCCICTLLKGVAYALCAATGQISPSQPGQREPTKPMSPNPQLE